MHNEYFTIVRTFHQHRDNPRIRQVTKLQLEMLLQRCDPIIASRVNLFLLKNFTGPNALTG